MIAFWQTQANKSAIIRVQSSEIVFKQTMTCELPMKKKNIYKKCIKMVRSDK